MEDVLVQTRVPKPLGKWIALQASRSGETAAAWLRRLLVREANMARVNAWVRPLDRCDPSVLAVNPVGPTYVLERLQILDGDQAVFSLVDADRGVAVTKEGWQQTEWFKKPTDYRFILEASPYPWGLKSASFNSTTKRVEVFLAVDHKYASSKYPSIFEVS
jgi:hypothetical protein